MLSEWRKKEHTYWYHSCYYLFWPKKEIIDRITEKIIVAKSLMEELKIWNQTILLSITLYWQSVLLCIFPVLESQWSFITQGDNFNVCKLKEKLLRSEHSKKVGRLRQESLTVLQMYEKMISRGKMRLKREGEFSLNERKCMWTV